MNDKKLDLLIQALIRLHLSLKARGFKTVSGLIIDDSDFDLLAREVEKENKEKLGINTKIINDFELYILNEKIRVVRQTLF